MGIFSTLLGNASNVSVDELSRSLKDIAYEGEEILYAFSYVRDVILFTTGRVIFVDKQGVTGKKKEFLSIPYRSISKFSIETTGYFDDDSEIKIWISGINEPVTREFSGDKNLNEVQKLIAKAISSNN